MLLLVCTLPVISKGFQLMQIVCHINLLSVCKDLNGEVLTKQLIESNQANCNRSGHRDNSSEAFANHCDTTVMPSVLFLFGCFDKKKINQIDIARLTFRFARIGSCIVCRFNAPFQN